LVIHASLRPASSLSQIRGKNGILKPIQLKMITLQWLDCAAGSPIRSAQRALTALTRQHCETGPPGSGREARKWQGASVV
jgi:hypothetical protein